jgi:hypothetical protein
MASTQASTASAPSPASLLSLKASPSVDPASSATGVLPSTADSGRLLAWLRSGSISQTFCPSPIRVCASGGS